MPGHHRDGTAALIGLRNDAPWHGLVFGLGVGPYRYFDARKAQDPEGFRYAHGWGALYSASASWTPRDHAGSSNCESRASRATTGPIRPFSWRASARSSTRTRPSAARIRILLGVGYQF